MSDRTMLTLNGLRYNYSLLGDGPPLLMLHGFTGNLLYWQRLKLPRHYRRCLIDLPGHGDTESPKDAGRYAMEHAAADLDAYRRSLNLERWSVLGYSMGGRLALYYALHYPQHLDALILESASPGLESAEEREERTKRDNDLADFIEREGVEEFVRRWEALSLFASQKRLPDEVRYYIREQRLRSDPRGLANSLRGMGTGVQPSLWGKLAALNVPTLLITGAEDEKFVRIGEKMANALSDAKLVQIDKAGHTTHLEQPEAFIRYITQFLDDIHSHNTHNTRGEPT